MKDVKNIKSGVTTKVSDEVAEMLVGNQTHIYTVKSENITRRKS